MDATRCALGSVVAGDDVATAAVGKRLQVELRRAGGVIPSILRTTMAEEVTA